MLAHGGRLCFPPYRRYKPPLGALDSRSRSRGRFGTVRLMSHQVQIVRALNPVALFNPGRSRSRGRGSMRGRGRGRNDRDENPSTGTWLLVAGATAAITGGLFALFSRDKTPANGGVVPGNGGTTPGNGGTTPGGGGGKVTKCIGAPGYTGWQTSRFPNEVSVGTTLEGFGYDVGNLGSASWTLWSPEGVNGITSFQREWNIVAPTVNKSKISVDGCAGPQTLSAMASAEQMSIGSGIPWRDIVEMQGDDSIS